MGRRKKGRAISGWLNVYKPKGVGSTRIVGQARRILNAKKVGHAGTLDPLAEGILPLAFGEATKVLPYVVDREKAYRFTVEWGVQTETDDLEGDVIARSVHRPGQAEIEAVLARFTGAISQVPPVYSALKINGQRAYKLARQGEDISLKARTVEVYQLDLVAAQADHATFDVVCGKGTYVRSLARDMAQSLGTLGHVTYLQRRRVGCFSTEDAICLENDMSMVQLAQRLKPLETVLDDIPALALSAEDTQKVRQGQALPPTELVQDRLLLNHECKAVAIAEADERSIRPIRVFLPDDEVLK